MSDQEMHFTKESDNLTVEVTRKEWCQTQFDIRTTPLATEAAYQKAIKNINKEVNIPGFRKGRAPEKMVLERYHDAIQKEFVDLVIQTGFNDAVHLTQILPLKDGKIKRPVVHYCSRDKGAHFTIEFESRPAIPSVNLSEIELEKVNRPSITDQERKNAIYALQIRLATYDPIEDRAAEKDDFVDLSVSLVGENPREVIKNQRTQVNEMGLPSWLVEKVIGRKSGETAEGMSEQDLSMSEIDPDYKPAPFILTVHSVLKGNLPEVNDELAKHVGLQTLDELHQRIEEKLSREIEEECFRKEIALIQNELSSRYTFDIPRTYIEAAAKEKLNTYLERVKEEDLSTFTEKDLQQLQEVIEKDVVKELRLLFILRRLAGEHNIEVNDQDLSEELNHQLALMASGQNTFNFQNKENIRERLYSLAMDNKVKKLLVSQVKFV